MIYISIRNNIIVVQGMLERSLCTSTRVYHVCRSMLPIVRVYHRTNIHHVITRIHHVV